MIDVTINVTIKLIIAPKKKVSNLELAFNFIINIKKFNELTNLHVFLQSIVFTREKNNDTVS